MSLAVSGRRHCRASIAWRGGRSPVAVARADHPHFDRHASSGPSPDLRLPLGRATPTIDALAADGIVFESAYAHAPQTLPSHVSILSGRLPFQHGVRDNVGFTVKPDERLLPAMLRDPGYVDRRLRLGLRAARGDRHREGFDHFDARMPPSSPEVAIGQVQRDGARRSAAADSGSTPCGPPRFFLFFHIYEPHSPYTPPARFAQYAPYDGEIAYADEIVGQPRSPRSSGASSTTDATIVLLSDHGEGLGDHGEQEHGLFLYRETIRVPLIDQAARPARRRPPGRDPVQHIDLVPTMLDLVGSPSAAALARPIARPAVRRRDAYRSTGSTPRRSTRGITSAGASSTRLTDARYSLHPRAARRALRPPARSGQIDNLAPARDATRVAMRGALGPADCRRVASMRRAT